MRENSPIDILMIDHVVLRTKQLRKMISFYRDVLGCPVEREAPAAGLFQLRAGNSLIDILDVSRQDDPVAHETGNMDHVCLQLRHWDTSAIADHLQKHDVAVGDVVRRYGAKGNGPSMYINDPDGNVVELKGDPD